MMHKRKKFKKKSRFKFLTTLLAFLCTATSIAAPTDGRYRLVNKRTSFPISEVTSTKTLICKAQQEEDFTQIWDVQVSNGTLSIKNVVSGCYIQPATAESQIFKIDFKNATLPYEEVADGYLVIGSTNTLLHCTETNEVKSWKNNSNVSNHWKLVEVEVDNAKLEAAKNEYLNNNLAINNPDVVSQRLSKYYTDLSCSELKPEYQKMNDADLKSAMFSDGIPELFQGFALKIKNSTWNEYEEEFRIQSYKPYSDVETMASVVKTLRYSFMGNPTGISVNKDEVLYVFVGDDVPKNATLYLGSSFGEEWIESKTNGVKLKKGLNIVTVKDNKTVQYVLYTAETFVNGQPTRRLSEFPNIKIHIEGGTVIGFWDKKRHKESDFSKLLNLSNPHLFMVKGENVVLNIHRSTLKNVSQGKVMKSIEWYDNTVRWQHELMGICDVVADGTRLKSSGIDNNVSGGDSWYPSYFNNVMALNCGYRGGLFGTSYSINYGQSTLSGIWPDTNPTWDIWGIAHEFGHVNQLAINLVGSTEASNNLFSNANAYLTGRLMSRGPGLTSMLAEHLAGKSFLVRDISTKMRMYYQLYLYYHVARNKTDFYPTLFQLLRKDPTKFYQISKVNGKDEVLHFVEKCCEAAGEDLTEFFEAWGMFVPTNNVSCGDYFQYYVTTTQADIDATKKRIAEKYKKKNTAILFIEDRIEHYKRADGVDGNRQVYDKNVGQVGELGQFTQYVEGNATKGEYVYSLKNNTITMDGTGGVGFKVYDKNNKLVTFSNTKTFTIPADLAKNGFTIVVMNGDNTQSDIKSVEEAGTDEQKLSILNALIKEAKALIALKDSTDRKVGFIKAESLVDLESAVAQAEEQQADATKLGDLITLLKNEIQAVNNSADSRNTIIDGCYYSVYNVYHKRYASIASNNGVTSSTSATVSSGEKWAFEKVSGIADLYYIKSHKTGKYASAISRSGQMAVNAATKDGALTFYVKPIGGGEYYLQSKSLNGYECLHCASSQSYMVVGWTKDSDASHWFITLEETLEEVQAKDDLKSLINDTKALVNSVCTYESNVKMQTSSANTAGYLSTNAQEQSEGNISNLLDNNTNTYFHSSYKNAVNGYHHLLVDLGEGRSIREFTFSYTTRKTGTNYLNKPTIIEVQGSNDNTVFENIAVLSKSDAKNPLPSNQTSVQSYKSDTLRTADKSYRYIRFVVKETNNNAMAYNYPFFTLSEFDIQRVGYLIDKYNDYDGLSEVPVINALYEVNKSENAIANAKSVQELDDAYEQLKAASDALKKAIEVYLILTSVEEIEAERSESEYFDLQGRKVINPTRGVFVTKGKVVIIR